MTNDSGRIEEQEMTVKEAIAAGYIYFSYTADAGRLFRLSDVTSCDFEEGDMVLADKEQSYMSVDAEYVKDSLIMDIGGDMETDDFDVVEDDLNAMDGWEEFAAKIDAILKDHPFYYLTKIKLKP